MVLGDILCKLIYRYRKHQVDIEDILNQKGFSHPQPDTHIRIVPGDGNNTKNTIKYTGCRRCPYPSISCFQGEGEDVPQHLIQRMLR